MERGNAHAGDNGQQDRGENDDCCQSFHEHANDEEQDVDDEQDEELAVREIKDGAGDGAWHILNGHDVAEDGGHGHQKDDGGRGFGSAHAAFEQLLQIDFAVDEDTDDDAVEGCHSSRLGGCHKTAVDTAKHDDRHHEGPLGIPGSQGKLFAGALFCVTLPSHLLGMEVGVGHEHKAAEDAGNDTADEEVTNGNLGRDAVDHKGVGRGNHDAKGACCSHDGAGEGLVVAALKHGGDGQGTNGCHCGRAGTGNGAKEHAGHDRGHGHAAVHAAEHGVGKLEQAGGKTAFTHVFASRDEEGDGHDGEVVQGGEGNLGEVFQRQGVCADDGGQGGKAKADGDGHAKDAESYEVAEKCRQGCNVVVDEDITCHVEADHDRIHGDAECKECHKAYDGIGCAADLDLLPQILDEPQAHEAEAYGQDEVGDEEGYAQGRGVLRILHEALNLTPAGDGNDQGEQEEAAIDHYPADFLPALRQFLVDDVDTNGRTLLDGNANCKVRYPDEDVAGNFFGPHHCACSFKQVRNDVAVEGLQGDKADNGYEAGNKKNLFEIFVKPVPYALFFFEYSCGHEVLSDGKKKRGLPFVCSPLRLLKLSDRIYGGYFWVSAIILVSSAGIWALYLSRTGWVSL